MNRLSVAAFLAALTAGACATPYVQSSPGTNGAPELVMLAEDEDARLAAITTSDGSRLPLRIWRPAGEPWAIIIGVHGFNDYSMTFDAAGRWWRQQGLITYAFDQRGFGSAPEPGTWPGIDLLVSDLEDAVQAIRAQHPELPLFLHGNSMGGAVVLVALQRSGAHGPMSSVSGASLTAPAVWGGDAMNPIYRGSLWLAAHTFPSRRVTGRGLGVLPSDNIEMLRALGRDPLVIKETRIDSLYGLVNLMGAGQRAAANVGVPLLIMYGARDQVIPRGPTQEMAARMGSQARFAVYPDGYHMLLRDNQAVVVWRDVASWVRDRTAPLPSGVEVINTDLFAGLEP